MKDAPPAATRPQRLSPWDRAKAGFWQCHRGVQASIQELRRRPASKLMTCLVIGIALALPGSTQVFLKNLELLFHGWEHSLEITIFLRTDINTEQAMAFSQRLGEQYPETRFQLISREQALQDFQALGGVQEALELLEENPLPLLLEAHPPRSWSRQHYRTLGEELQAFPEVEYARYEAGWRERLEGIHKILRRIAGLLLGLLSLVVLLVVGNTIRLGVYARREELEIALLFGADGAFVRRPFLYSGMLYGAFGGVLAWGLSNALAVLLRAPVAALAELYASDFQTQGLNLWEGLGLTALGACLGILGAAFSVHRQVREIAEKI